MDRRPQKRDMRVSDADRHRIADFLRRAAGDGRLTLTELEERLDRVFATTTYGEIGELTADLPGADYPLVPTRRSAGDHRSDPPGQPRQSAADLVGGTPSETTTSFAVFGSSKRSGEWVVPETYQAFAMYGGVELDLRQVMFEAMETTIHANCLFGSVVLVVPDDILVRVSGLPLFGGYGEVEREALDVPPDDAPILTVKGVAVFGGVEIQRRRRRPKRQG